MDIAAYAEMVRQTDQTSGLPAEQRLRVLRYGLVGEIGSIVAAVKKRLLDVSNIERRRDPTGAIGEELGDCLWYCFALHGSITGDNADLVAVALTSLRDEVSGGGERSRQIEQWLGQRDTRAFLQAAARMQDSDVSFRSYQDSAFLTARTRDEVLIEVCLSVLTQLAAELLREHLPPIERHLNRTLPDRSTDIVLSEILWHLSALATLFDLRLDAVADANRRKLLFRLDRGHRTPLHDAAFPEVEQLPRRARIDIVRLNASRSRMIWGASPLGDDLTDNAHVSDGYRFHDVMHLANAATLGWSPVLRALMGRKRKSVPEVDEVEDGARARIVEEAVVKIIHSEGVRIARERGAGPDEPMIRDRQEVSFAFLKLLRSMVAGLEVAQNRDWEWEEAILAGHRLFAEVRHAQSGGIDLNLDERRIAFTPPPIIDK